MKLADYVVQFLADLGISHVFCISGNGNLHLIDSLSKNPKLKYICTQHEQSVASAAEAYAKATENIGAAIVTTGPGGTNTVTGVVGAWLDSVPVIYISGQVNVRESIRDTKVRQFGIQEINIVDIVRPITKYAVTITDPRLIRFHLTKALYLARKGRPGPVWLDIPLDVSHAEIEPDELEEFSPPLDQFDFDKARLGQQIDTVVELLGRAARPVILAGAAIKRGHARKEFDELVKRLGFPILLTYSAADLLPDEHNLCMGRPGVNGMRSANLIVQNSDLLLSLGSRLNIAQTSSRPETYARAAKKIVVDIDENELNKNWVKADLAINADIKVFLQNLLEKLSDWRGTDISSWLTRCRDWKKKYHSVLPEYYDLRQGVNSYVFLDVLSQVLENDDVFIHDMGSSFTCTMQTFKVKAGQYLSSNYGFANMGYGLPAVIGTWFSGKNSKRIVFVVGDGGFQMSLQELQTIVYHKIPAKIFVLNNHCYLTIKSSQITYFGGHLVASTPKDGYSTPDFVAVAKSYGLSTESITNQGGLAEKIKKVLDTPGPVLCDVLMPDDQQLIPKLTARQINGRYVTAPLEDMYPFLPREEFLNNMIIDPLEDN